jgi:hypothetical protein
LSPLEWSKENQEKNPIHSEQRQDPELNEGFRVELLPHINITQSRRALCTSLPCLPFLTGFFILQVVWVMLLQHQVTSKQVK